MKKHIFIILGFSVILFIVHFFINNVLPQEYKLSKNFITYIHTVLLSISSLSTLALHYIDGIDKNRVGQVFLGLTIFKMLVVLCFILIQIKVFNNPKIIAYHLLIIYFLHLILISLLTFKIINSNNYGKKEQLKD